MQFRLHTCGKLRKINLLYFRVAVVIQLSGGFGNFLRNYDE